MTALLSLLPATLDELLIGDRAERAERARDAAVTDLAACHRRLDAASVPRRAQDRVLTLTERIDLLCTVADSREVRQALIEAVRS